jgi:hypothetical protein
VNPHCFIWKVILKATGETFKREPMIPDRWYRSTPRARIVCDPKAKILVKVTE